MVYGLSSCPQCFLSPFIINAVPSPLGMWSQIHLTFFSSHIQPSENHKKLLFPYSTEAMTVFLCVCVFKFLILCIISLPDSAGSRRWKLLSSQPRQGPFSSCGVCPLCSHFCCWETHSFWGARASGCSTRAPCVAAPRLQETAQLQRTGLVALQYVGSSWTRGQTHGSCVGRWILYPWVTREAHNRIFSKTSMLLNLNWVIYGKLERPGVPPD